MVKGKPYYKLRPRLTSSIDYLWWVWAVEWSRQSVLRSIAQRTESRDVRVHCIPTPHQKITAVLRTRQRPQLFCASSVTKILCLVILIYFLLNYFFLDTGKKWIEQDIFINILVFIIKTKIYILLYIN